MIIGKTYYLTRGNDQVTFKVVGKNCCEITIEEGREVTKVEKNEADTLQYWLTLTNAGFEACQEEDLPIVLIEE